MPIIAPSYLRRQFPGGGWSGRRRGARRGRAGWGGGPLDHLGQDHQRMGHFRQEEVANNQGEQKRVGEWNPWGKAKWKHSIRHTYQPIGMRTYWDDCKEVSDEMKYMYIWHRILLKTRERRKLRTDKGRKRKPFWNKIRFLGFGSKRDSASFQGNSLAGKGYFLLF